MLPSDSKTMEVHGREVQDTTINVDYVVYIICIFTPAAWSKRTMGGIWFFVFSEGGLLFYVGFSRSIGVWRTDT